MLRTIFLIVLALNLASCQSQSSLDDVPAIVDKPTPASHGEIVAIISSVLNQSPVMISHDALTRTNLLVIERKRTQHLKDDRDGRRINETSAQFRLVKNGSNCVLIYVQNQSRFELNETSCSEWR